MIGYLLLLATCLVDAVRVPTNWDYSPQQNKFDGFSNNKVPRESREERPPWEYFNAEASTFPSKAGYPGEGVWAKPYLKHKPNLYDTPSTEELSVERPKGYETYQEGARNYEQSQKNFDEDFGSLDNSEASSSNDDGEAEEFVPVRTYSQVRKYENNKHLPASVLEPRLKEIVTKSKIHTVYTEEGYEDAAYDHAGHEKKAENNEGFEVKDSDSAGSDYYQTKSTQVKMKLKKQKPSMKFAQLQEAPASYHIDQEVAKSIKTDIERHFKTEQSRPKRFTNDFPKIDVDSSFLESFTLPPDIKRPRVIKYPYYESQHLPKNSPLRYSEDMKNIPTKAEGRMAFYNQANSLRCEEIDTKVNPVPARTETGDKKEDGDDPKLPRLRKLGDKIDCFKLAYFGENPLDSPIFQEDVIAQPEAIFPELARKQPVEDHETEDKFVTPHSHSTKNEDSVDAESEKSNVEEITENVPAESDTPSLEDDYEDDQDPDYETESKIHDNIANSFNNSRQPKVSDMIFDVQNTTSTEYEDYDLPAINGTETLPESQALRMRRRRRRRRKHPAPFNYLPKTRYAPKYQKYPYPKYSLHKYHHVAAVTPIPQYHPISEVYYKDEIKPNEQLNVFADVINNIQHHDKDLAVSSSEFNHEEIVTKKRSRKRKRPNETEAVAFNPRKKKRKQQDASIDGSDEIGTIHEDESNYEFKPLQSSYSTIDIKVNRFLVPGMKPPPIQEKPFIYSDYQMIDTNQLRRLDNHRAKRGTRLAYSEIKRTPTKQTEEEEEDDYVPHRPTSYHYDPGSNKIIYDKSKQTTTTEAEYEEIIEEVTEAPKSTTTHKTVYHKDVLNKENGLNIGDFLAKLKSDPSYKYIEDPEPTEKTTTTTMDPAKTTPPEFLKFLQKLHEDKDYKRIDDEKEDEKKKESKTTTSTTEAAVEENEEEASTNIQNSPGGQFNAGLPFQLFDISEFIPKTFTPRTAIDYGKYKTIERSPSKQVEEEEVKQEKESEDIINLRKRIQAIKEEEARLEEKVASIEQSTSTTTTTTESITEQNLIQETTTTLKPARIRFRGTRKPTTSTTTTEAAQTHRPPSRVYPRRPRPKIRLRSTTPSLADEEESIPNTRTQRRLDSVPSNHKAIYAPITLEDRSDMFPVILESHKKPRLVTPDILVYNMSESDVGKINPRKLDIEVFEEYDKTQKHGGNYKAKPLVDAVNKPSNYYEDTQLSKSVNVLKQSDDTDKHKSKDYDYDDEVKIYFRDGQEFVDGQNDRKDEDVEDDEHEEDKVKPKKKTDNDYPKHNKYFRNKQASESINKSNEEVDSIEDKSTHLEIPLPSPPIVINKTTLPPRTSTFVINADEDELQVEEKSKRRRVLPRPSKRKLPANHKLTAADVMEDGNNRRWVSYRPSDKEQDDAEDTNTKKTVIIKDPSKRLYYYAPV